MKKFKKASDESLKIVFKNDKKNENINPFDNLAMFKTREQINKELTLNSSLGNFLKREKKFLETDIQDIIDIKKEINKENDIDKSYSELKKETINELNDIINSKETIEKKIDINNIVDIKNNNKKVIKTDKKLDLDFNI